DRALVELDLPAPLEGPPEGLRRQRVDAEGAVVEPEATGHLGHLGEAGQGDPLHHHLAPGPRLAEGAVGLHREGRARARGCIPSEVSRPGRSEVLARRPTENIWRASCSSPRSWAEAPGTRTEMSEAATRWSEAVAWPLITRRAGSPPPRPRARVRSTGPMEARFFSPKSPEAVMRPLSLPAASLRRGAGT